MALFSFGDIKFKEPKREAAIGLDESRGDYYQIYRYPLDLGDHGKGHYVMFYVNEQLRTQFKGGQFGAELPSVFRYAYASDAEAAKAAENFKPGDSSTQQFSTKYLRTIRRISDAIALYMPDTLMFSQNQRYGGLELAKTNPYITAGLVAGGSAVDTYQKHKAANAGQVQPSVLKDFIPNLSPILAGAAAQQAGGIYQALFSAVTGVVQNPMAEVLYSNPSFREFNFDFMFYPRSEKEAEEVQRIIHRFRFHQAPEIDRQTRGFFFVPPSEFDIKFYYNGYENENIPKISTCVLTNVSIDYAPNGFAAYEVPGDLRPKIGRSGMPVATRLTLQFQEVEMITKGHLGRDPGKSNPPGTMEGR
jgi:hypothetical protein